MSRRVLITSALVALLLGLVALAPTFPPVRSALLRYAGNALSSAGIQLHYDHAGGNAWSGVQLTGVRLTGFGSVVELDGLQLGYHLPSLLGGELPLDIAVQGVSGDIDLTTIEQLLLDATQEGGAGPGLPIRVVLRQVSVTGMQLRAQNAPFTLPDGALSDITVQAEPGALQLGATLTTDQGRVVADGRLAIPSFDFTGTIQHLDVAVARQWWPGAVAGTAQGQVAVRRGQVNADLRIEGAAVQQSGFVVTGLNGVASMRYPLIHADLSGVGLGGPVRASGTVDVEGHSYDIEASATPALADVAAWLTQYADLASLQLMAGGSAKVNARVTGWLTPQVRASATAAGTVQGLPLRVDAASFDYAMGGSMRGTLSGALAGGSLHASIAPGPAVDRLQVDAQALDLTGLQVAGVALGGVVGNLRARVDLKGTTEGTVTADWRGDLAGYPSSLEVDGRLDGDGLQGFFSALVDHGADAPLSATGAVVYAGQRLDAGLSVADLTVPGLSRPLRLGLSANGPLTDLQVGVTFQNDNPVLLDLALLQPGGALAATRPIDLRGGASGRLHDGAVTGVTGSFGPLSLSGNVLLNPLSADFGLQLQPLALAVGADPAAVGATVAVPDGRLAYADGRLTLTGATRLSDVHAGPVTAALDEVDIQLQLTPGAPTSWQLDATDPQQRASFTMGSAQPGFDLTLLDLPVYLSGGGRPALVSGSLLPASNGLLTIDATLAPGSSLGGPNLLNGARIDGVIDPARQRLDLTGAAGALPLGASVDWSTAVVTVAGTVGGLQFALAPTSGDWSLQGDGSLQPLLTELGIGGLQADFEGSLAYDEERGYAGTARLKSHQPAPATLTLRGAGRGLSLQLQGQVGGVPVAGSGVVNGPLLPGLLSGGWPSLLVDVGPLRDLTVDLDGVRGAGQVEAFQFGPLTTLPAPWSLDFDWATTRGYLEVSGQAVQVALDGGVIRLAGGLAAAFDYAGQRYDVTVWPGSAPGSTVSGRDVTLLPLGGAVTSSVTGRPLIGLAGNASDLAVKLEAGLPELAAALPPDLRPTGVITASAKVDLLNGPSYGGTLLLSPAPGTEAGDITASFSGVAARFDLTVDGAGLALLHLPGTAQAPGRLTLNADSVDLGRFLPPSASGRLDGSLSFGEAGWTGALQARLAAAGDQAPLLDVTADLLGAGGSLQLAVTGTGVAGLHASGGGDLLPQPQLTGSFGLLDDAVQGQFTYFGGLDATLVSAPQELGGLRLPAQRARLRLDQATGAVTLTSLDDTGPIDLHLTAGQLQGSVFLPLELLGVPARLAAQVSGPLADPRVSATLRGAGGQLLALDGSLATGAAIVADLTPAQLTALLPSSAGAVLQVLDAGVSARAALDASGGWDATLRAPIGVNGRRLQVTVAAAGQGVAYQGAATLHAAARPQDRFARADFSGSAADVKALLDLGRVDWDGLGQAVGVPLQISGDGSLAVSTAPLAADLTLDLTGTVGDTSVRVRGHAPRDLTLSLAGPQVVLDGDLAWGDTLAAGGSAKLDGTLAQRPVQLALQLHKGLDSGSLLLQAAESQLTASLTTAQGAATLRHIAIAADVPAGSWAPLGGTVDAQLTLADGRLDLTGLVAQLASVGPHPATAGLSLELAGGLTPDLNLKGSLASPQLSQPAALSLRDLNRLAANLTWRDLGVTAQLRPAASLGLSGSATTDDLLTLARLAGGDLPAQLAPYAPTISAADLGWSLAHGWSGTLQAQAAAPWLAGGGAVTATATADGGRLQLSAAAQVVDGAATASAVLPERPWTDSAVTGQFLLDLPAAAFDIGALPAARLAAQAQISGTTLDPTIAGAVTLTGPLAAEGDLNYLAGAGTLNLDGAHLQAQATFGASGLQASAAVTQLDLQPWLPLVPDATLSLDASLAHQQLSVTGLQLRAHGSVVTGSATLQLGDLDQASAAGDGRSRLRAALSTDVDLADVQLGGTQLSGRVLGPLIVDVADLTDLGAARLIANLAVLNLSSPFVQGGVSGNLSVGGRLNDPGISASLVGEGSVSGVLTADVRPASGLLVLNSSLAWRQFASDLRLDLGSGELRAGGTVRWDDAILLIDDRPDEAGQLAVLGAGRLAGLSASVSPDLSRAQLGGSLDALGPGVAGQLQLTLDAAAPAWLRGSLTRAAVGGVELDDVDISSGSAGAPIRLHSRTLDAVIDPTTLGWSLEVARLALTPGPDAPLLYATASGQGAQLQAAASLSAAQFGLAASISHDGATQVTLGGTALGGQLQLSGQRDRDTGEWGGQGSYAGGTLGGFQLSANATLLGADLVPQLVLSTRAHNGMSVTGTASLGTAGVTIDQLLTGGPLEQAVRLQGRLLPGTDLTVSSLQPAAGATLTAAAAERLTTSRVRLLGAPQPGPMHASGALTLPVGPARVELAGSGGAPHLTLALRGLPDVAVGGDLPGADLLDLVATLLGQGLTLTGQESARGGLHLDPASQSLRLDGFGIELGGLDASLSGSLGLNHADVSGELRLSTDLPVAERDTGYVFPWHLTSSAGLWRLASDGPHGQFSAVYDQSVAAGLELQANLTLSDGSISGTLGLQPAGLAGSLTVSHVRVLAPALGAVSLDAEATVADGRVGGRAALDTPAGRATLTGNWGLADLLPAALVPGAPGGGRLDARLGTFELSALPLLADNLPQIHGQVSGVAQLRDGFLLGQLASPEIGVADLSTPLQLSFSGPPSDINLELLLRGVTGRASLKDGSLAGMLRLERFPLTLLSSAVVGPSDFLADLTGVLRFDGPLADPAQSYLRLATEEVRLERLGVTTIGNVTLTLDQGALTVERAQFQGEGAWSASGVLQADKFDFQLQAVDADFTPLLGLAPALARLGVGAAGSFDLAVRGNADDPRVTLTSPGLQVQIAGGSYGLSDTALTLESTTLSVSSRVLGLQPVAGALDVSGGANLSLFPFALANLDVGVTGDIEVAGFGQVRGVSGQLSQQPGGAPTVSLTGTMGSAPLSVAGTLAPLALRASGAALEVAYPGLLIEHAVVDADITLTQEAGGVALGGHIDASEVTVNPAVRPAPVAPQPAAPQPAADGGGLAGLRFDDLAIVAPGRVTLTTGVGSFEAALNLQLSGTAAAPRLTGSASALRGNLRFGGRDFTVDRAVATFTPNSGVYPALDVVALTEFEKTRVLSAAPGVAFAAPQGGSTFQVRLAFTGQMEAAQDGGIRFDVRPVLTSNALIELKAQPAGSSATRPFTEAELMSLVTLGRFELNADLIGAGGLGEAVAQGALDTAVDLLVVSGLESALREALGLDVVEIRTSAISSLLDESGQPFGVSLRVGGYLNPELFASYRIGTYEGADPNFSLTNEVLLRYALGPIDLDLIGRVDIPTAGTLETARPELGLLVGYQFSPLLGVDAGVTLGSARSKLEFGVTLRW